MSNSEQAVTSRRRINARTAVYETATYRGTRLIYYNKAQCHEMEAVVKDSGYVILWVIDEEKSQADEHYISYRDVVKVIPENNQ